MKTLLVLFLALISSPVAAWAGSVVIRNGDQLELRIGGVPPEEISQVSGTYLVDEEGFINLPNLGKIKAAGETQASLQRAVEEGYRRAGIYPHFNITINPTASARYVNLGGDTKNPGRIPYTADLTILTAIDAAGGFTEYASQKAVRLFRDGKLQIIDIPEIRRDRSKDIPLNPRDSIEVGRSLDRFLGL